MKLQDEIQPHMWHFIDWIMKLPEDMEEDFWHEVEQYEEDRNMPYVTSVERIGIKKGIYFSR